MLMCRTLRVEQALAEQFTPHSSITCRCNGPLQEMRNCAFEVIAEWIEELGDLPDSDNKHQVQKKIERCTWPINACDGVIMQLAIGLC